MKRNGTHPRFGLWILLPLLWLELGVLIPKAIAQTPIISTPKSPSEGDVNQLLGQWEAKDPLNGDILRLVFTSEGRFYTSIIQAGVNQTDKIPTLELSYQINSQSNPKQIDLISLTNGQRISTIWELTEDGKLRIDFGQEAQNNSKPTTFSQGAILLERVTTSTELPSNIQIFNRDSNVSSVKQDIDRVNREQTLYFLENNKFANTIEQLGLATPLANDNYVYQLQVKSGKAGFAIFTAKAKKPNLNSYVGAVFEYKSKDREKTIASIICETDSPSQSLPNPPTLAPDFTAPLRCATGSRPTQP